MKEKMTSLLGERMDIYYSFSDKVEGTPLGKAKLVHQELDISQYLQ